MPIEIVPLTPERRGLFLDLFDGEGFADNPGWADCYCRFYHYDHDGGGWDRQSGADNRAAACDMIAAQTMQGWLALDDGGAVGWLNAARKDAYCAFRGADVPGKAADETGMIACFLVAPSARGKGVARALMDRALAAFRDSGLKWAEAKPSKSADTPAGNYHGPLAMYLKAGFRQDGDFSEYQHLVRLAL
ncbi:GNAT family N-acetyltransferase [Croceicoccus naphthovorans]|uniref:Uncharacterized protein n=1 Tax=Croceicoccus naphthovorans TaxID=1348774 RepID=A0A0G3XH05_9SPHN|nr:GNAT family N-acetyltransferase [Croceicoccus naphthovorans]AKM10482.1 hypothetical protein AB433_11725 [Croceicoccus naphthovorans]MBB3988657.1 GNAT superfamily N-acetyltransferase [Croceicoccus naphthovorans]